MPISYPEDHPHPAFPDQREYDLHRAVIDTGDEEETSTVVFAFRHRQSGRLRKFKFSDVVFAGVRVPGLRGASYPVYVAATQGRQWSPGLRIEVGDTDPGGEWFWAAEIEEIV